MITNSVRNRLQHISKILSSQACFILLFALFVFKTALSFYQRLMPLSFPDTLFTIARITIFTRLFSSPMAVE